MVNAWEKHIVFFSPWTMLCVCVCVCVFTAHLQHPEMGWEPGARPTPSQYKLKLSVHQRGNKGPQLIPEAWPCECRLPLNIWLRLSNSPWPLMLWTCCLPPWQQLVATGMEETRSTAAKVQIGIVWARVRALLLRGRAWRWSIWDEV